MNEEKQNDPKQAFNTVYNIVCGEEGIRLTLPEHKRLQALLQIVQQDMKSFEVKVEKNE